MLILLCFVMDVFNTEHEEKKERLACQSESETKLDLFGKIHHLVGGGTGMFWGFLCCSLIENAVSM